MAHIWRWGEKTVKNLGCCLAGETEDERLCPSQTNHKASSIGSLQLGGSLPLLSPQKGTPSVMLRGARRHPTSGHLLTASRAGCGESLCSQSQELHRHTCRAEWSFSSCLARDRPCSYKQVTSGEASCAAASDTRSLKVVEMNECGEPSWGCSHLRLAAAGSAVCVSAQARVAPGGGPAWSCCRCRSLLSLQLPPDPITWQVSVEAGTIRCQFAARLAEAPQRCQLPSVMRAGPPCASPEHSWGFGACTGLPCLCDALTATTRAAASLQHSPDSLMILCWSLRMWMSSFFWWEHS